MDRQKKMVVGGIVATSVVVVFVILVWPRGSSHCTPQKDKPEMAKLDIKSVGSAEGKVVANLVGYIEFAGETPTYLPLDVTSVAVNKPEKDGDPSTVTVTDRCGVFTVQFTHTKSQDKTPVDQYSYNSLKMEVKQDGKMNEICTFDSKFSFVQPAANYYSCTSEKTHSCSKDKTKVANLVLKSFELELDAPEDKAKAAEFSKPAWPESCGKWS